MKIKTYLLLLCMLIFTTIHAQRYLAPIFTDVTIEEDLQYGLNADISPTLQGMEAQPQVLKLDVYTPEGDVESNRPLIIMLSPGFYVSHPDNFQVYKNDRKDLEMVYMAERLAKYGYVVAILDLRLGWNPTAVTQPERAYGYIQAITRQCQDLRTAIRFFRKSAIQNNNPFGIDPDKIVGWGNHSGFLPVAFTAYVNDYESEYLPNYLVYFDNTPGPAWIEEIDGDIYALEVGINPDNGDTLSYPNHLGFSSDLNLAMQIGGATLDTITISPGDPPLISCRSLGLSYYPWWFVLIPNPIFDPIVPHLGVGEIHTRIENIGLNDVMQTGTFTDPITAVKEERSANNPYQFPQAFPELFPVESNYSTPWSFWDTTNVNNDWAVVTSPNDHDYCKSVLDTIIDFYAPRACLALNLECAGIPSSVNFLEKEALVEISPNPATTNVLISADYNFPIKRLEVYDFKGHLVKLLTQIETSEINLERGVLAEGIYMIKVYFEKSFVSKKLVFLK